MVERETAPSMGAREWAMLLALSVLWGGSFYFFEVLAAEPSPFTVVLGRVGLAALALNMLLIPRRGFLPTDPRLWGAFLIMGDEPSARHLPPACQRHGAWRLPARREGDLASAGRNGADRARPRRDRRPIVALDPGRLRRNVAPQPNAPPGHLDVSAPLARGREAPITLELSVCALCRR